MSRLFPLSSLFPATLALVALAVSLSTAPAAEPTARPLRELSTDRPDATEGPFTVDAGRIQLEMSAASYTRNRLDGVRTTEWVLAPFNVRLGVTPQIEAGLFVTPHQRVTEQPRGGAKTTVQGTGDTVLRAKYNFWGNDGGSTALGVFVDVKLPTAADGLGNDKVEAGVALPLAFEVGAGWDGAGMTRVDFVRTEAGRRRSVWVNTVAIGRDIVPDLGMFLELVSAVGDGAHVLTFNCGLTRKLGEQLQLDLGVNFGVTRTAPDLTVFAGFSRKF